VFLQGQGSEHAACLSPIIEDIERSDMKKLVTRTPATLSDWIEFYWLLLIDPTFQASRNKRKAYFDYRLAKRYNTPFC